MSRVAQRLALLDLLVNYEVVLHVAGLLLEGCHAKLLVCKRLLLAAGRADTIMRVVAEVVVEVSTWGLLLLGLKLLVVATGANSLEVAEASVVLYPQNDEPWRVGEFLTFDYEEGLCASTEACDRLAQVLGQALQLSVRLFSDMKDLAN